MNTLPTYSMFIGCEKCEPDYTATGVFCPRYFSPEPGELWQVAFSSVSLKHQPSNWPLRRGPFQADQAISENCTISCTLVKGDYKERDGKFTRGCIPLEVFSVEKSFFESGNPNFKDAVTIYFTPKYYNINTYGPEFEVTLRTPISQEIIQLPAKITYHMLFRRIR